MNSRESDVQSELETGNGGGRIVLRAAGVAGESVCSTGYSPVLSFDVPDMDTTIQAALQEGASLDGPIKYPAHGKAAMIRSPCGHMIGLFEPAVPL
jgi:hypothetical protein